MKRLCIYIHCSGTDRRKTSQVLVSTYTHSSGIHQNGRRFDGGGQTKRKELKWNRILQCLPFLLTGPEAELRVTSPRWSTTTRCQAAAEALKRSHSVGSAFKSGRTCQSIYVPTEFIEKKVYDPLLDHLVFAPSAADSCLYRLPGSLSAEDAACDVRGLPRGAYPLCSRGARKRYSITRHETPGRWRASAARLEVDGQK